jgi:hypothetical protein
METKPFSLQSPEQIAKDYGGNKQKIAEAMQMGIVDPTAGTLAAMFIDRMRGAAQAEAVPQQSVAQQVFAPPQPQMPQGLPQMPVGAPPAPMAPAGLGVTPEAAAMPAPEMAMPGMAMGGMVPPYASGGLTSLSVPDDMFDEPSNGSYANGGLVAFAGGTGKTGVVEEEEKKYIYTGKPGRVDETDTIVVDAPEEQPKLSTQYQQGMMFSAPEVLGGFRNDLLGNLDRFEEAAPRSTKRAQELEAILEQARSPEERKKRKQEDMWAALGQIGAKMASTPGSLLQAASAGIGEALPGIAAAAKERRGEERAITKELLAEERTANKELETRAGVALDMLKNYNSLEQAFQDQNFKNVLTRLGIDSELAKARIMAGAGIREALISASAQRDVGRLGYNERRGTVYQQIAADWDKNALLDPEYRSLVAKDPTKAAQFRNNQITQQLNSVMPPLGGGNSSGGGSDPLGLRK